MFRTVWTTWPCDRCGVARRVGVQFKTGDDGLEDYEQGDALPEEEYVKAGDTFRGIVERYCEACNRRFEVEYDEEYGGAMRSLMEEGRLVLRSRETRQAISAEGVESLADDRVARDRAALVGRRWWVYEKVLRDPAHELTWNGARVESWDGPWRGFRETLDAMIDAGLRGRGWRGGRESYEDPVIVIDDERRVYVAEAV